MAEATTPLYVKHSATNPNSLYFGPPTGEILTMLQNLGPRAKKDRLSWLEGWAWHKMPEGPYPFHFTGYGWTKVYLIMEEYHAVYIQREDLNLDVEVLKIQWSEDGMTIEARKQYDNFEELLDVKVVLERYDAESNRLVKCLDQTVQLTYKEVVDMIRNEVAGWAQYDEWFNERIQGDRNFAIQRSQQRSQK